MFMDTATHCNTLQHTATHCNTLQHTATQSMMGVAHTLASRSRHVSNGNTSAGTTVVNPDLIASISASHSPSRTRTAASTYTFRSSHSTRRLSPPGIRSIHRPFITDGTLHVIPHASVAHECADGHSRTNPVQKRKEKKIRKQSEEKHSHNQPHALNHT